MLLYRMDRMSERLNKHGDRLNVAKQRISDVEDIVKVDTEAQKSRDKILQVLQSKARDLKAK